MSRLKRLMERTLTEVAGFTYTEKDIQYFLDHHWGLDADAQRKAELLWDWLARGGDDAAAAQGQLDLMQQAGQKVVDLLKLEDNQLSLQDLRKRLIENEMFLEKIEEFFPIPVYVSHDIKADPNTIGLMLHWDGKLEEFEGNDEASDETYQFVTKLMGGGKQVKIWGSHDEKLLLKIKQQKHLEPGMYVSPMKSHAEGYWGEGRVLFSGTINDADVRKESHVDWQVIGNAPISNMMIF